MQNLALFGWTQSWWCSRNQRKVHMELLKTWKASDVISVTALPWACRICFLLTPTCSCSLLWLEIKSRVEFCLLKYLLIFVVSVVTCSNGLPATLILFSEMNNVITNHATYRLPQAFNRHWFCVPPVVQLPNESWMEYIFWSNLRLFFLDELSGIWSFTTAPLTISHGMHWWKDNGIQEVFLAFQCAFRGMVFC